MSDDPNPWLKELTELISDWEQQIAKRAIQNDWNPSNAHVKPKCECGGTKLGLPHSPWCPVKNEK